MLRKQGDQPLIAMLDLWRSLSEQKAGLPLEVMTGDRKEHRQLCAFSGELYTAYPSIVNKQPVLVLYLDSLNNVKPILVTHEIGHWVLKLQGFVGFIHQTNKHSNTELLLNSMAHHVPLYALQRSVGHDPQEEVDSRALHNLRLFSKKRKRNEPDNSLNNALMLADDIMNCSQNERASLKNVLVKKHPETSKLTNKIVALAKSHVLHVPQENLKFCQSIIKDLKLGGRWSIANDVGGLESMVRKASEA